MTIAIALRIVLCLLIVISIWLFWLRFGRVVERILTACKDADYHLQPVSRRAWNFFWEVLCQAKVIRERPGRSYQVVW
jgi:hypothetical protein